MSSDAQRTEQPTQFRLRKAREEGRFPVSKELVQSVQFLLFVALLTGRSAEWWAGSQQMMKSLLTFGFRAQITQHTMNDYFRERLVPIGVSVLETGALIAGVSLAVHLSSTGFGIATSKLAPNLSQLNPAKNLMGAFSRGGRSMMEAVCLFPLFLIAGWVVIFGNWANLANLPSMIPGEALGVLAAVFSDLLWKAACALALWGAIDVWRQRRRYMRDLRMTKQEIRDEHKQNEGNPEVKARIRRVRREMLRRRMMSAIPGATAIIVNPTHFAVALRYAPEGKTAPTVVAKGKNYLALRIRQRALAYQIPVIENPPLAQALYKQVEVGQEIPVGLYHAVAEVLAYVFRMMRDRANGA